MRIYLLAGRPHGSGIPVSDKGICQEPRNPLVANPAMRALLVALDAWAAQGVDPPESEVPRVGDATLIDFAQQDVGFPHIPGIEYNGRMHEGDLMDFGPQASEGILTLLPPHRVGSPYPALVPKTDADGGSRLALLCDASGMVIPFARTKAERTASGDPRLSLEERYPDRASYVRAVSASAHDLTNRRLLLAEDEARYIKAAEDSDVGR